MAPWTKLGQREMSHFIGRELLYDYLTHQLDNDRKKAVDDFIHSSKDAQNEMMRMMNGIEYAERLSETVVSHAVLEKINEPSTYMAVLLKKTNFQKWPISVKWSLEAMVVISIILTATLFMPWDRVAKMNPLPEAKETILAEVDRDQQIPTSKQLAELEKNEPAQFTDEEKGEPVVATPPPAPKVAPVPVPTPAPVPAPTAPVAAPVVVEENPPETKVAATTAVPAAKEKKPSEGSLLRGQIDVTNLEVVGPKIRDKIIEMGGRKAGEVELGWNKTPKSSYFHFTFPEAKHDELVQFLNSYGKLKIAKEKHPRVMPDGIIRLIITVDEAGP